MNLVSVYSARYNKLSCGTLLWSHTSLADWSLYHGISTQSKFRKPVVNVVTGPKEDIRCIYVRNRWVRYWNMNMQYFLRVFYELRLFFWYQNYQKNLSSVLISNCHLVWTHLEFLINIFVKYSEECFVTHHTNETAQRFSSTRLSGHQRISQERV